MFVGPILAENDAAQADLERAGERLAMLRRLAQLGMDLAQALRDRVMEGVEAPLSNGLAADPALSFTRVARAVRQSLALEARLEDERRALGERTEAAAAAARAEALAQAAADRREQIGARKQAVWTALTPEIEAATTRYDGEGPDDAGEAYYDDEEEDDDEFYALTSELNERLADAAEREDFLRRPVEAIIAEIRQALGLGAGEDEAADAAAFRLAARRARSSRMARAPLTCAEVAAAWGWTGGAVAPVESG